MKDVPWGRHPSFGVPKLLLFSPWFRVPGTSHPPAQVPAGIILSQGRDDRLLPHSQYPPSHRPPQAQVLRLIRNSVTPSLWHWGTSRAGEGRGTVSAPGCLTNHPRHPREESPLSKNLVVHRTNTGTERVPPHLSGRRQDCSLKAERWKPFFSDSVLEAVEASDTVVRGRWGWGEWLRGEERGRAGGRH